MDDPSDHETHLRAAWRLAAEGHAEGDCPIGAVLVDNATGRVLGQGRSALAQEGMIMEGL